MKNNKMKTFKAIVYGLNQYDKPFKRTLTIKGIKAKDVYNELNSENGINEVILWEEDLKPFRMKFYCKNCKFRQGA